MNKFLELYNELWNKELFQFIVGIILLLLICSSIAYIPKCNQEFDEFIYAVLNFIGMKE